MFDLVKPGHRTGTESEDPFLSYCPGSFWILICLPVILNSHDISTQENLINLNFLPLEKTQTIFVLVFFFFHSVKENICCINTFSEDISMDS